ncbi:MlaD family protein [Nocardia mangyaensis]|uniref:MlaD family protein n=1 Tax=Nocardia mangyaensis TaxID=2213200 RepID=UPI0026754506|nr:MlaD family protein [Nocardia mangyaensis]MDO3650664.1 MlaD family protein [Nocardia mangyaensis]
MSKRGNRVRRIAAVGASVVVVLTGCGIDPARLTLPGAGIEGQTYPIHIEFTNTLNLPSRARVMANGAEVGRLTGVTLIDPTDSAPGSVLADIDIAESVALPNATTAQLRQDTILGDIYIALDLAAAVSTAPKLAPGATIPRSQTKPALQVEDVLAGLATFVSGGALRSAQEIVENLNAALPEDPAETQRIASVVSANLIDLAANQHEIDAFLESLGTNTRTVLDNTAALDRILTPQGVVDIAQIAQSLIGVVGVIGALGDIVRALTWIAPLAEQGNAAARAFVPMLLNPGRPLNLSAPSNLVRLEEFLREQLIPWAERPKVDLRGVRIEPSNGPTMSTDDQVEQIVATLRMIGIVR